MVKAVHLSAEQFTVDNNLMTPTFKLKRAPLQQHFQKEIDAMYEILRSGAGKVTALETEGKKAAPAPKAAAAAKAAPAPASPARVTRRAAAAAVARA